MSKSRMTMYKNKIERILDNRLEYNGDNTKELEIVHYWLACEWQADTWMSMEEFSELSQYIDDLATEKIKML